MNRRGFLGLSAAIGATAFAPSLFAKENFTMWGAPAIPSVIMAVASMQGQLAKTHDVRLRIWNSTDQLRAGVANGEIKITMAPSNVGANMRNHGLNLAMLNLLSLGTIQAMVKDENIKTFEDFIGKKLIIPFKGDMPDLVLRALCKKRGIDISKIDITYTQTPPEAAGLFLQKDYDILIAPQPLPAATILRGKKMGIAVHYGVDIPKVWGESFNTKPYIPMAGIIVDVDFYKANLPLFDTLHSDLTNALSWIKDNKQSAAKIGAEYLPAPEPALVNAFDRANLTVTKARDMQDEIMSFFETIFEFNPKLLGGKMPDKSLFL